MAPERDIDRLTGTATTGHEWDGIRELNTPMPRWWLLLFYATIAWSVGYWVVYPSWPLVSSYTRGVFNWHSREAVIADLEARYAFADLFDDAAAFVAQDRRKRALGVRARQRVRVGVTNARRDEPHEHLAFFRPLQVHFFDLERLAGCPSDCCFGFHCSCPLQVNVGLGMIVGTWVCCE